MNEWLAGWAGAFALTINVVAQVSILSLAAIGIGLWFGRRNAALRHRVYVCALLCVLAAPLLAATAGWAGVSLVRIPVQLSVPTAGADVASSSSVARSGRGAVGSSSASYAEAIPPVGEPTGRQPSPASGAAAIDSARSERDSAVKSGAWTFGAIAALTVAGGVWATVAMALAVRLVLGWMACLRARRLASPVAARRYERAAAEVCDRLGIGELPPVAEWDMADGPMSIGVLRPMVILPTGLIEQLTTGQLRDVLIHECAHVLHRDTLVGLAQRVAQAVFWPHPLVHWLNRQLGRAREEVCDNYAVAAGVAGEYAQTLLTVACATGSHKRLPAVGLILPQWRLENRIAWLLDKRRSFVTRLSRPASLLCAAGFALAVVLLATCQFTLAKKATPMTHEPATVTAGELPAPGEAVVLNLDRLWRSLHWSNMANGETCSLTIVAGAVRLEMPEPRRAHTWLTRDIAAIDPQRYPIFVMTYRAKNLRDDSRVSVVRLQDHRSWRKGLGVFPLAELIDDGDLHVVRSDTREFEFDGDLKEVLIRFASGVDGSGMLEIRDLRFETAPRSTPSPVGAGEPVSVVVVDSDGAPVADAKVTVDSGRLNWSRSGRTDGSGRVTLSPLKGRRTQHFVRVEKPGMVPVEKYVEAGTVGEFELPQGVRYGGVVVDAAGRPIAGAGVGTRTSLDFSGPSPIRRLFRVLTDEQGRWRSPVLQRDLGELSLQLSHPEYLFERNYAVDVDAGRQGKAELVMRQGCLITGVVLDPEGRPVPDARLRQGPDRSGWSPYPHTRTDGKGRFSFYQGVAGQAVITVQANDTNFAPELVVLSPKDLDVDEVSIEVRMKVGGSIRGRVVDTHGDPLVGIRLIGRNWRGFSCVDAFALTDEDGRFVIADMPNEPIRFVVDRYGFETVNMRLQPRDQEYEITLRRVGEPATPSSF